MTSIVRCDCAGARFRDSAPCWDGAQSAGTGGSGNHYVDLFEDRRRRVVGVHGSRGSATSVLRLSGAGSRGRSGGGGD